jgi:hypothetical protein
MLRWAESPGLWRRMLGAARDNDGPALAEAHLEAKLRLAGDLLGLQGSGLR